MKFSDASYRLTVHLFTGVHGMAVGLRVTSVGTEIRDDSVSLIGIL